MSIKIIRPGVLATLQDAGRFGYRGIGIGSGGAMDIFAMKVAQYLCGNEDSEAVIEMNFPAPEILFEQDAIISITGADFTAVVNETIIPAWRTCFVKKDSVLKFKQPAWGAKAYLAVHGGWQAEKWLGSYSTHGKLTIGGFKGRALQKDDVIFFKENNFSDSFMKGYEKTLYDKLWKENRRRYLIQRLIDGRPWLINGVVNLANKSKWVRDLFKKI